MTSITVTAARPHSNEYGDTFAKDKGDKYDVPATVAESLLAGGWVDNFKRKSKGKTDVDATAVSRGEATGTSPGATGKGSDQEVDGKAGA